MRQSGLCGTLVYFQQCVRSHDHSDNVFFFVSFNQALSALPPDPPLPSLTSRESDFVGFDASEHLPSEEDDERTEYRRLVETYREHLVAK